MNEVDVPMPGMEALGQVTGTFALVLALFKDIFFLIFLALFLAFDPKPYREGLIALFPRAQRSRAREVLAGVLQALRAWLLGRLISMVVLGVVIWLGLWLLGVPLALPLAVLAGLFEFVPIVGPIVAAIPAILVAFVEGPMLALYVAILYFVVQQLESSLLTPLVQERTVKLPPALTLFAVLAFGLLFGVLGAILATPLAAVLLVLVKMLYVEGTLERR
jgi:predicted PurR-regulated permease PerM